MGLNEWITIQPAPMASEDRFEEVDELAKEKLGVAIQDRLRTRVDPGIDLRSVKRVQSVRVAAEGGRLVISEEDPGEVLSGSSSGRAAAPASATIDSLFEPSSGIPELVSGPSGETRMVFRAVSENRLFGTEQDEQDRFVGDAVADVVRMDLPDAFDQAHTEVSRRGPAGGSE